MLKLPWQWLIVKTVVNHINIWQAMSSIDYCSFLWCNNFPSKTNNFIIYTTNPWIRYENSIKLGTKSLSTFREQILFNRQTNGQNIYVSFHGILVADELICLLNNIFEQLFEKHPWTSRRWILPSCVKIAYFVQKLWQISSSATRMPWNDTFSTMPLMRNRDPHRGNV